MYIGVCFNHFNFSLLSSLIMLPIFGSVLVLLTTHQKEDRDNLLTPKRLGLWITLAELFLATYIFYQFDHDLLCVQFYEKKAWLVGYNIFYSLGIDGISLLFIMLTAILTPICMLAGWESIHYRSKEFIIAFLLLEAFVMGTFCAMDTILFYVFFEGVLIPMYFIIGIWGGKNCIYASYKFFIYTLAGSLLMLITLIYIYVQTGTTDIILLYDIIPKMPNNIQIILWLGFFASFAVKVPMFPVHTWLPDAHVQAPTSGSIILAGILLKLGGYGFLRFSLPMLPYASLFFSDFIFILSIVAVIYASLVALMQEDIKKMIAYSSIAHMGFVTAGIFSFNAYGMEGAVFQMISHGLVSGALFLCAGILYDRMKTKDISFYGGLAEKMPKFAVYFLVFTMASIGLPATSGFVGEFLVMLGVFTHSKLYGALIATGVVLGAAYMLWLYARLMYGEIINKKLHVITDINCMEKKMLLSLVSLVFVLGIYPKCILDTIHLPTSKLLSHISSHVGENNIKISPEQAAFLEKSKKHCANPDKCGKKVLQDVMVSHMLNI